MSCGHGSPAVPVAYSGGICMRRRLVLRLLDRLESWTTNLTAVMMIILALLVGYMVFSRYVLNTGQFWAEEFTVILLMWIGMLGAAGSVWTESHMGLEIFLSKLPDRIGVWIKTCGDLVVCLFSFFLFKQGISLIEGTMIGTLSTVPIPIGYTYYIIPASAGLMLLFSLAKAVNRLVVRFYGERRGC